MHGDVEVPENAYDRFDRVFVEKRIGDVVVDFAVGNVAAFLAERDELQKTRAAVFLRLLLRAVAVLHGFKKRLVARRARLLRAAHLLRGAVSGGSGFGFRFGAGLSAILAVVVLGLDVLHVLDVGNILEVRDVFVVAAPVIVVNDVDDAAVVREFVRIFGLLRLLRCFFLRSRLLRRLCRLGSLFGLRSLGGLLLSLAFIRLPGFRFCGIRSGGGFRSLLHARLAGFLSGRRSFLRRCSLLRLRRLLAGGCLFFLQGSVLGFCSRSRFLKSFSGLSFSGGRFLDRRLLFGGLSQPGRSAGLFSFNGFNGQRKARGLELRRRLGFLLAVLLRARFDRCIRNDILLCLFSHRHVPLLRPFAA